MRRGRIYNKIYTPELWEQVNQKNKDILADFIAEYHQRRKSQSTIDAYYQDARVVFIYILRFLNNKCILDLHKKDFRGMPYLLWLGRCCGDSSSTMCRKRF